MHFAEPTYLFAIPVVIILITLIYWVGENRMRSKLTRFVSNKLIGHLVHSYSLRRQVIKGVLVCLAFICFIIALARPQWGNTWEKMEVRGIDILIALDTSKSMLAEDLQPNRMERAKLAIQDLLPQVEGNRIGLITFAGQSYLQCPLTLDMSAVQQTLTTVDTDSVPQGGTDLATAITDARLTFNKKRNHKFLVIITDGEDLEASGIEAARQAAAEGVIIYTVGVGSTEGALIPITDNQGNRWFMKDQRGEFVKTRLDENTLKTIAQVTKGMYTRLGSTGLDQVYEKAMETIPEEEKGEELRRVPIERFQWPLGFGILLLMLEGMISVRKHARKATKVLLWALLCLGTLHYGANKSYADEPTETQQKDVVEPVTPTPGKAYRNYKESNFKDSAQQYTDLSRENPKDARLEFNRGDALYRNGQYSDAVDAFISALKSKDTELQADSFYNLGNTYNKMGENRFETNPKDTRLLWEQGIKYFDNAAIVNEEHENATYNAQALRDRLESILRTLTVEPLPAEGGSVEGGGRFAVGEKTIVKAKVNEGWRWDGWRCETPENIENPDKETTTVTVAGDISVGASFIKTYHLEVKVDDPAAGTAEKSGIYDVDSDTPIKATSNEHYTFDFWDGDGVADIHNPETTIKIDQDKTVTAHFAPAYELKVKVDNELAGKTMKDGWYKKDSEVPIQYMPHDGWELDHWEGADHLANPQADETSLTINRDTEVTAITKRVKKVILYARPEEGGTVLGNSDAEDGTVIDIEAAPAEGYTFKGWEGAGIKDPTSLKTKLTVNGEEDVFAIFENDNQDQNDNQGGGGSNNQNQDSDQNQDKNNNNNQSDQQQNQNQSNNDKSDQEQQPQDQDKDQSQNKDQNQDQSQDQNKDQQNSDKKQDQQDKSSKDDKKDSQEQPQDQKDQQQPDQGKDQQQQNKSDQQGQDKQDQGQEDQAEKDQNGKQSPEKQQGDQQEQPAKPEQGKNDQGQEQGASPEEQAANQANAGGQATAMPAGTATMSPTEAGQLLDSIKNDEEKLPISILMGNRSKKNDSEGRNW